LRTGAPESAVWTVKSAAWLDGSAVWALESGGGMLGSDNGNLGRGAWSPGSGNWQPGSRDWLVESAVWTDGSADGAPGGFQTAVQRLAWRDLWVARTAAGTGHAGPRGTAGGVEGGRFEAVSPLFVLLLFFVLAFHVPFLRLSLVRSVIHFPLQP